MLERAFVDRDPIRCQDPLVRQLGQLGRMRGGDRSPLLVPFTLRKRPAEAGQERIACDTPWCFDRLLRAPSGERTRYFQAFAARRPVAVFRAVCDTQTTRAGWRGQAAGATLRVQVEEEDGSPAVADVGLLRWSRPGSTVLAEAWSGTGSVARLPPVQRGSYLAAPKNRTRNSRTTSFPRPACASSPESLTQ